MKNTSEKIVSLVHYSKPFEWIRINYRIDYNPEAKTEQWWIHDPTKIILKFTFKSENLKFEEEKFEMVEYTVRGQSQSIKIIDEEHQHDIFRKFESITEDSPTNLTDMQKIVENSIDAYLKN